MARKALRRCRQLNFSSIGGRGLRVSQFDNMTFA